MRSFVSRLVSLFGSFDEPIMSPMCSLSNSQAGLACLIRVAKSANAPVSALQKSRR